MFGRNPIVGGVQDGHQHLNPKNHASKGIVAQKMPIVMKEFKKGDLHSGSKNGPVVKNQKQAVAIAMSYAKKKG